MSSLIEKRANCFTHGTAASSANQLQRSARGAGKSVEQSYFARPIAFRDFNFGLIEMAQPIPLAALELARDILTELSGRAPGTTSIQEHLNVLLLSSVTAAVPLRRPGAALCSSGAASRQRVNLNGALEMISVKKTLFVAAMGAAALAFSALSASADIACTGEVC
jgi:hypothetical protein